MSTSNIERRFAPIGSGGRPAAAKEPSGPGNRVAIGAVTMSRERIAATRNTRAWIRKYILPGGPLPSAAATVDITERYNLRTVDAASLRPHFAETLRLCRERFLQRRNRLAHLGFDEVSARMWELYPADPKPGFRSGRHDADRWVFERRGPR
ncbi:MAG: hypothetical protein CK431_27415 [Mycobacterium sp.]|nr:MAG: hypothetical protein CK431_27415 [Mycobacterium sp.]